MSEPSIADYWITPPAGLKGIDHRLPRRSRLAVGEAIEGKTRRGFPEAVPDNQIISIVETIAIDDQSAGKVETVRDQLGNNVLSGIGNIGRPDRR